MEPVLVVGAGVVGLTAAIRLREAGFAADVVARELPGETTSAVAAALWYPYRALPRERVLGWSARTFDVLAALAEVPGTGVRMRTGTELLHLPAPDPWWRGAVPGFERAVAPPPGYTDGFRFRAPVADMSVHLPWLVGRLRALGGGVRRGSVEQLDGAGLVVNCAGLGARELAGDPSVRALRGQVVRVETPHVEEWLLDQSDPERLVYVVPRERDVVLGGTAEQGAEDRVPDPATAAAIVERCTALLPALSGARVVGQAVGLRPVRPAVRLEREGRIVHCYGHGGAGVTLSWGCAEAVVALVGEAAA